MKGFDFTKKEKTYIYSVNNAVSKGEHMVKAYTKKEAIEKAKERWWGGVNVSSFKVKKVVIL